MATEKKECFLLPDGVKEGRLINHALFERDAYARDGAAPGKPKYKIEMVFDPADVHGEGTIEDKMADAVAAKWGEAAADLFLANEPGFVDPRLSGDRLAADRAARGKEGDAYKGKTVIRADTSYNKEGIEGPGGVAVYGPDTKPILALAQGEIFAGCYGIPAVTISCYDTEGKDARGQVIKLKGIKFYLVAFQKTRGEAADRLSTAADRSSLFKPVGGSPAADPGVRRGVGRGRLPKLDIDGADRIGPVLDRGQHMGAQGFGGRLAQ